jgi:hypothetical protein
MYRTASAFVNDPFKENVKNVFSSSYQIKEQLDSCKTVQNAVVGLCSSQWVRKNIAAGSYTDP